MKSIELHYIIDKDPVTIFTDKIVSFYPCADGKGTTIDNVDGSFCNVLESYKEVARRIFG